MTNASLLNVEEAAQLLGLKVSTIRAWILHRRIPHVKLGLRAVRLRREDVQDLITAGTVPARPQGANR
jgi:excisionase family DNA binding protein